MSGEEGGPEEPEALDLRQCLVFSGEGVNSDYTSGVLVFQEPSTSCAAIAVAEVDQRVLVAVPEGAWHKTRKKRAIDPDCLQKVIAVLVPCCAESDRSAPLGGPSNKIWLGLLKQDAEALFVADEGQAEIVFPMDANGVMSLPFASALVAAAQDHFTFLSAESASAPPGLGASAVQDRLGALEEGVRQIQAGLAGLKPPAAAPSLKARPKAKSAPLPEGIDPAVAQQALQAGVSPAALHDMAAAMGLPWPAPEKGPKENALAEVSSDEEEDVLAPEGGNGLGSGGADPLTTAVLQLTKLVSEMQKAKVSKKDKELESILDRAESGYAKESVGGSTRSKAAALLSLQQLLRKNPKLLYTAIEDRLQEDWEQAALQPGVHQAVISARGWIEHRSKIQHYPATIRAAWALGGIWDCLRSGRVEEARARAALGVCMLDQQSCDAGSWLLAGELSLESPPPMSSFQNHQAPAPWELPHSRLVDPRWFDLVMSKVKDLADFHEKRAKLSGGLARSSKQTDEQQPAPKAKAKPKAKGNGKGKTLPAEESKENKEPAA